MQSMSEMKSISRLADREFNAMDNPLRRTLQRGWEFPML
jgi:hypothetical protein